MVCGKVVTNWLPVLNIMYCDDESKLEVTSITVVITEPVYIEMSWDDVSKLEVIPITLFTVTPLMKEISWDEESDALDVNTDRRVDPVKNDILAVIESV